MPEAGEGCNIIMVRALNRTKNEKMKKILELYLWRYAGLQNFKDGTFSLNPHRIFTDIQIVFLQIFLNYNQPISKVVILRALPWIIKNQNKDGSWGTELAKDTTTFTILSALLSLGEDLPSGCFP